MVCLCSRISFSRKRNEGLSQAATWVNLGNMPSERRGQICRAGRHRGVVAMRWGRGLESDYRDGVSVWGHDSGLELVAATVAQP